MKKTARLIAAGYLVFVLASCSKRFLDISPYASVSEKTLANKDGVNGLLIGAYSLLDGGGETGGGYVSSWTALLATDDARKGSETGVSNMDAFVYDQSEPILQDRWQFIYAAVQRCNDVLRLAPKATDATDAEKLQFVAEARFLRGIYYLQLATLWKNVPWIDETVSYSQKNYLVSNTEDIYPHIEDDFGFAADNLTATKSDVGRGNKWAAKAFLAETYMFEKKFDEAKDILSDIITNGATPSGIKYKLVDRYGDLFKTANRNNSEAVFEVQMSVNDGAGGANGNPMDDYNGTFGGPATCCYGWFQPTFDLIDAFQTDAVTGLPLPDTYMNTPIPNDQGLTSDQPFTPYAGTLDPRLDWSVGRRGIPYLDWGVHPGKAWVRNQYTSGPYSSIKNTATQAGVLTDRQGGGGATNTPYYMIRYAEVLLWAAECEVEVGSLAKAEEYVNQVRARAANPGGFVHTYIDNSNPTAGFTNVPAANYKIGLYTGQFTANGQHFAREAVRFENRLEMAMEHKRQLDMRRYDGNDYDMSAVVNSFMARESVRPGFNTANNYLTGKFIRGKHELFPIPQGQIDRSVGADGNSVLIQNPGW